jgi:hypothetical protein
LAAGFFAAALRGAFFAAGAFLAAAFFFAGAFLRAAAVRFFVAGFFLACAITLFSTVVDGLSAFSKIATKKIFHNSIDDTKILKNKGFPHISPLRGQPP